MGSDSTEGPASAACSPLLTIGDNPLTIGIDLGQKSDPTAIVVCEEKLDMIPRRVPAGAGGVTTTITERGPAPSCWTARAVTRLPLNTSYPDVAKIVAGIVSDLHTRHQAGVRKNPWPEAPALANIRVIVDATGVGVPVVELIREALKPYKATVVAATFTYGRNLNKHSAGQWTVGKAYLVGRLQALLQSAAIKLPDTPEVRALCSELEAYEIRISDEGKDTYGAKTGKHDDMATALGLATLIDTPRPNQVQRVSGEAARRRFRYA